MSKLPKYVELKIPVESVQTADVNKLVGSPDPDQQVKWIFRVNGEADFFNYQQELMGTWIHDFICRYLASNYSYGRRTWKGRKYIPAIIKFGSLIRNTLHSFFQQNPDFGKYLVEGKWTFTFRVYPDFMLDGDKKKRVWSLEFIQITQN